ncbi:MAG: hypothetical protein AVDCRST_MAG59-2286 [uncultured Thermomicrobiales bacterium]|uniref:Uncharacterized protein n=1 Tax=uncultured Thermomicrobiales bacterium TaxID=1645740 RepID=A0A6J4URD3_9BACT|nr:MAG: hypothetical protein AVDCRST_MAG59-2286 [uncultured Thermomicrobiales bacterium]
MRLLLRSVHQPRWWGSASRALLRRWSILPIVSRHGSFRSKEARISK